ncbi:putative uncharacterized protein DDB_G0282133 isoform X3 [Contarinia nasturtii]|uniref:putative uncharacterized protein DDB_G0282133 isoform X3 n=1 Tax=Contarinia nasturtii TaxID=265458 RepID=UPI0012D3C0F3|nr:putative uncharacterized protein DDB_G0282133 isoform X3 [Contarinia nasturtii]
MDNEPNENESEVVESCEDINENGCDDEQTEDDVNESEDKDETEDKDELEDKDDDQNQSEQLNVIENKTDEECMSPKPSIEPSVDDAPSDEPDQFAVIDSDNPSENSPQKSQGAACTISSPSETEPDELENDKSWNQLNESSPTKSLSEVAIISSPSEESQIEKNWDQPANESLYDDDSMDEEPESDDDENDYINRSSPKLLFQKQRERARARPRTDDCQVFELTDDNSSGDDGQSEVDDDIEGEEEEESDSSYVQNIDDSDEEPYIAERNIQNVRQIQSSHSAKNDIKQSIKSYDNERSFDEDAKFEKHSAIGINSSSNNNRKRCYLKQMLQKQSASKLQRYLSIKKSIKCLNKDKSTMRDNRGNRMVEVLNSGIDTGSSSSLVSKSTPVDASVLKERNINETGDSMAKGPTDRKVDNEREGKLNAQNTSELMIKRSISQQSGNDLMINLDLDELDYDEKCAKALTSEGDNDDSQNALSMDVDEPSENLYVTNNNTRRSGSIVKTDDDIDDPVTIESEDESKSNAPHESTIVVNGINKGSSSTDDGDDKEMKTIDDNKTKTTNKSNKRKISISSDDEQAPPAKNPRNEVEENFSKHDKMMRRMIESSTSANKNDPDNLQRDIDQLTNEIEALDEAARTKEIEWNNILYLKKMKEDMLLRLDRKKKVIEIMATKSIDNPESLFLNSTAFDCLNELNASESRKSGTGGIGPATSFIMSRCNMKSIDLAKEKSNLNELHRNIQPKSTQSLRTNASSAYANVVTSIPKSSPAIQAQQQQQTFLSQRFRENGQSLLNSTNQLEQSTSKLQIGRQGQIKDVQSIIANFRQTHPEVVPRRGRRMKNINQNLYGNEQGSNSAVDNNDALVADLLAKRNNDISSPPSSNDSTYSNSQVLLSKPGASNQYGSIAAGNFKQAFNENNIGSALNLKNNSLLTSTPLFKNQNSGIGYPEVTLHPIGQSNHAALLQKNNNDHLSDAHTNSLLHGILTKSSKLKGTSTVTTGMTSTNTNTAGFNNAFSPTLARLLTAPERNFALSSALSSNNVGNNANNNNNNNNNFFSNQSAGINLTKPSNSRSQQDSNKPEISCLPISQILAFQQQQQQQPQNNSLLQQQLQRYQRDMNKFLPKNNVLFNLVCGLLDDEADDSDRLVIDEEQYSNSELISGASAKNDDSHENELPECQGCKKREAQFVCADCQRQWYCSRECQVMAWDSHSEVCTR